MSIDRKYRRSFHHGVRQVDGRVAVVEHDVPCLGWGGLYRQHAAGFVHDVLERGAHVVVRALDETYVALHACAPAVYAG